MMTSKFTQFYLLKTPKNNTWLLWFIQLLNIVLLSNELSAWLLGIVLLFICWQALLLSQVNDTKNDFISHFSFIAIPPFVLVLIGIACCTVLAISSAKLGILISMIHLLTFAYVLKFFEIKSRKDFYQFILLGLFLLASAAIFNQSLSFTLLLFLALIINLLVLHQVFVQRLLILKSFKTVGVLCLQSTILAIVLFVFFPRLSPFWQVPLAKSGTTGLSDVIKPGDIANLSLSSELAFRASFKDKIPAYSERYWRAMTLENYDGYQWTRVENTKPSINQWSEKRTALSERELVKQPHFTYQLLVEPSYTKWLYTLVTAYSSDHRIKKTHDNTLQSSEVITQPQQYAITSYLNLPRELLLKDEVKDRNLKIPYGRYPRLENLALQLSKRMNNPLEIARTVLHHFNQQAYYYTLQPTPLVNNSLEQFYFETKSGFCIHYASTFTYLMRAAGIPARVVTGYLGGEYNTVNKQEDNADTGYLNVYQYDAHAWSEIWIDGLGWYRIDPTSAVDPERVNTGWSPRLFEQQSTLNSDFISLYHLKKIAWLNALRLQIDALNFQWTRWVLGFSANTQKDLFKELVNSKQVINITSWVLVILIITTSLFILWVKLKQQRKEKHIPIETQLYKKCLRKLKNAGIKKEQQLTPLQFAFKVKQKLPRAGDEFIALTNTYIEMMYDKGNQTQYNNQQSSFVKQVHTFLKSIKK